LAATIIAQIGNRGIARRLFENFKKSKKKLQNSIFKILVLHFLRLCLLLCIEIKTGLDSNKSDGGDMFEVCPYGDSGNGTAVAARRSAGYSD